MSMSVLAEDTEPTWANMSDMILTLDRGGIAKKVAELKSIGNIKG
jgi:hypothetical protein